MLRRISSTAFGTSFIPNFEILSTNVQAAILEALALARTYADQVASGLDPKEAVKVATDAPLPGTISYATLNEINSDAALGVIDGSYTPLDNDRILVKNQAANQYNGIYVVNRAAAPFKLTRSSDADNLPIPSHEVTSGMYTIAVYGAHGATGWVLLASDPITINVTPLPFGILCMADAASVTFTPYGNIAATTVQTALQELDDEKVIANAAIVAGTNTKITYDTKGLVTSGAAATTADIADSTDKRYCTDAQKVVIGNTSNTNTGDVTIGAFGSTPDAAGISRVNQVLTAQPADATHPGMLSIAAQTFAGAKRCSVTALTSTAATIAVDLALNNDFSHTTTENTTLAAPTNVVVSQKGKFVITQGATPRTLAFNAFYKFANGIVPALTPAIGAVDVLYYDVCSPTWALCSLSPDVK